MPLPKPIGRQADVLALKPGGHTVVLGTAGSGKTTLAILRAAFLAHPATEHHGKTLLVTFNRTLVTYLRHLGGSLGDVVTETYHKFALGYLAYRGVIGGNAIVQGRSLDGLVAAAVDQVAQTRGRSDFLRHPTAYFRDEIAWISRHAIRDLSSYQAASERGPSTKRLVPEDDRAIMFDIWQTYRTLRSTTGKMYDWDDVASAVCQELDSDRSQRLYKHVVIDEGQDFSPEMVRSLAKAVPPSGSLTFFADVAQQIYGHRVSWRDAGLMIDQPWYFRENYRNTAEIARLALAITRMPYYQDVADLVEPTSPRAAGPPPILMECASRAQELSFVLEQSSRLAQRQSAAILVRDHADLARLRQAGLPRNAVHLNRDMRVWRTEPGLRFGTYHSAKGLEFDAVFLPFLSSDRLPDTDEITAFGTAGAAARDGRLLYVAVTRARTRLVMSFCGKATSLLPTDRDLYVTVEA